MNEKLIFRQKSAHTRLLSSSNMNTIKDVPYLNNGKSKKRNMSPAGGLNKKVVTPRNAIGAEGSEGRGDKNVLLTDMSSL